ncbi:hypothetical protein DYBT9623_03941 [Dyadobacter sp. CECT 9623]|uniref:Uncharacterized protein n=1 Tax=Dyadobacter linearis TaxID=2823330 RepID=A0ABN7RFH3_9BACT|nr:hypothetical protein DYBT9623_03941 [Dyadobacter sp. CECT 9623]
MALQLFLVKAKGEGSGLEGNFEIKVFIYR